VTCCLETGVGSPNCPMDLGSQLWNKMPIYEGLVSKDMCLCCPGEIGTV
jgi:hypothetical protein